jgi:peroxiredoxin
MTLQAGDTLPQGTFKRFDGNGIQNHEASEILHKGTVVLIGVPGAFTPTCHLNHLPGYVEKSDSLKNKGIDATYCMTVNDPFVAAAWENDLRKGKDSDLKVLSDWDASYAKALGLTMDGSGGGLGIRAQRFVLIAVDGVIKEIFVEDNPGQVNTTGVDTLLSCTFLKKAA